MAAGTAAAAMGGGAGNNSNTFGSAIGGGMGLAQIAMQRALEQRKKTTSVANTKGPFGRAGMGKRLGSIESRLDALEGGGEGKDPIQSVKPVQEFSTGGSFGSAPPAPVATGTLNASTPPGSLDEAMPSPGDPASDMFGTEFMRSASVGAAKMRMNKKI